VLLSSALHSATRAWQCFLCATLCHDSAQYRSESVDAEAASVLTVDSESYFSRAHLSQTLEADMHYFRKLHKLNDNDENWAIDTEFGGMAVTSPPVLDITVRDNDTYEVIVSTPGDYGGNPLRDLVKNITAHSLANGSSRDN
jgi:hypothetical protein